jgi:hypothetical protein
MHYQLCLEVMMSSRYNTSALTENVSYNDAKKALPKHERKYLLVIAVFLIVMATIILVMLTRGESKTNLVISSSMLLFLPIIALVLVEHRRHIIRSYRLQKFAQQNGMTFIYDSRPEDTSNILYRTGHSHIVLEGLLGITSRGKQFEIMRLRLTTGRGRGARNRHFMYIKVGFQSHHFPDLVLNTRRKKYLGIFRVLPYFVPKGRSIDLVGPMDQYFVAHKLPADANTVTLEGAQILEPVLTEFSNNFSFQLYDSNVIAFDRGRFDLSDEHSLENALRYVELTDALE